MSLRPKVADIEEISRWLRRKPEEFEGMVSPVEGSKREMRDR